MAGATASGRNLGPFDRGLYALFARHADSDRHDRDRQRYRAAGMETSFDVYLARTYGLAWVGGTAAAVFAFAGTVVLSSAGVDVGGFLRDGLPVVNQVGIPSVPGFYIAAVLGVVVGIGSR